MDGPFTISISLYGVDHFYDHHLRCGGWQNLELNKREIMTAFAIVKLRTNPDSMTTLAQRWHSIAPLAYGYPLGVLCWPNIGPTMP